MSGSEALRALLAESLLAWGLSGGVEGGAYGPIIVSSNGRRIAVERATARTPFRWMVTIDGRTRGAISVIAVLRQVRAALDPGYAAGRARVAASAPVQQGLPR